MCIICSSIQHTPSTTLFPYTTLFRSDQMDEVYRRLKKLMDEGTYANLLTEITRVLNKKEKPSAAYRELKKIADKYSSRLDRKSTRLNSSHVSNSYAVFCLITTAISSD